MIKKLFTGLLVGRVAGWLAGILLAPRSGVETRQKISSSLSNLMDEISEQLSKLGKVTRQKYDEVVTNAVDNYSKTKKISEDEKEELISDLQDKYEKIKEILS